MSDGRPPLVVACLRITDLRAAVDPLTGAVTSDGWSVGLSRADAAALEHALRAGDAWSARVLAITGGGASAAAVLRGALAVGAEVLRIPWPARVGHMAESPRTELSRTNSGTDQAYVDDLAGDERGLAKAIADAITPYGRPDLVMCGDRSADRGTGAFPSFLAHELGAAQALGLVSLGFDGGKLVAERRLDGGRRERLEVSRPAVCSIEGAGVRLRRASLAGMLDAERAVVPVGPEVVSVTHEAGGATSHAGPIRPFRPRTRVLPAPEDADPRMRLLTLTGVLVDHDPPTVVGPVDAVAASDALIDFLVRHGYLDGPPGPHGGPPAADGHPIGPAITSEPGDRSDGSRS